MTTLASPSRVWWKPLGRDEKVWVTIAILWCLFLFLMMWIWPLFGQQNTPIESYKVNPGVFATEAQKFVEANKVGEKNGIPVVRPKPGADIYLTARMFHFSPILELKKGETYRLLVSSLDNQHGLSIQPVNLNFQVLPGYIYVINITPDRTGEFTIVCNEYCGPGHHLMVGQIIVTE